MHCGVWTLTGFRTWLKSQIVWLNRLLKTLYCALLIVASCKFGATRHRRTGFHLVLLAAFCLQSSAGRFKKGSLRRRVGPPSWLDLILFYFLKKGFHPTRRQGRTRADASNVNRRDSFEFIGNRLWVHVKQQPAQLFCVRLPILGGGGGSGGWGVGGGQAEVKSETGCCITADVARQKNTNKTLGGGQRGHVCFFVRYSQQAKARSPDTIRDGTQLFLNLCYAWFTNNKKVSSVIR